MENVRKVIVGYDLTEGYSQISCYSYKSFEPIPISPEGQEDEIIPLFLGVNNETRLWSYGREAVEDASLGKGVIVDGLLQKITSNERTEVYGESLTGVELLEKYLRKTLGLVKQHFPSQLITMLVVTITDSDPKLIDGIYEALAMMGVDRDRATVMGHGGAYLYYALSQEKALWVNDVGLFDFDKKGLHYYQISVNRRTSPMIAGMEKRDFSHILKMSMLKDKTINPSYIVQNIAEKVLYKQIVSTIYFTGIGFEGGWAQAVIEGLCTGRRVFYGQNLFSKGACYAAKELSGDRALDNMVLLDNEMLLSSISIRIYSDGAIKDLLLTDAGVYWYEVDQRIEVIPEGEIELELISKNIMTRESSREILSLDNLADRPDRMTRLELWLTFTERTLARLTVTDLGFGEIYPATNQQWEFLVKV